MEFREGLELENIDMGILKLCLVVGLVIPLTFCIQT